MDKQLTAKEGLIKAKALIKSDEHWTQNSWARDKNGQPCSWCHPDAQRYCSLGALSKAFHIEGVDADYPSAYDEALRVLYQALTEITPRECVVGFNDSRTHEEVMKLYSRAIELA